MGGDQVRFKSATSMPKCFSPSFFFSLFLLLSSSTFSFSVSFFSSPSLRFPFVYFSSITLLLFHSFPSLSFALFLLLSSPTLPLCPVSPLPHSVFLSFISFPFLSTASFLFFLFFCFHSVPPLSLFHLPVLSSFPLHFSLSLPSSVLLLNSSLSSLTHSHRLYSPIHSHPLLFPFFLRPHPPHLLTPTAFFFKTHTHTSSYLLMLQNIDFGGS